MNIPIIYNKYAKKIAVVMAFITGLASLLINMDNIYTKIKEWISDPASELIVERIYTVDASDSIAKDFGSWQLNPLTDKQFLQAYPYLKLYNNIPMYKDPGGPKYEVQNQVLPDDFGIFVYHSVWKLKKKKITQDDIPEEIRPILLNSKEYANAWYSNATENVRLVLSFPQYLGYHLSQPQIRFIIRNDGNKAATFYGLTSKNLFSFGGEAGAGGAELKPSNSDKRIDIHYDHTNYLQFKNPIILDPGDSTLLAIVPNVIDAAQGDGPGEIIVNWSLDYNTGINNSNLNLGNFLFEDSVMSLRSF